MVDVKYTQLNNEVSALALGQVGYIFNSQYGKIIIDPYISDALEQTHGAEFKRLVQPKISDKDLSGIKAILLSHEHDDHTDPASIEQIFKASGDIPVICPPQAREILISQFPIQKEQLFSVFDKWYELTSGIRLTQVPSAHPNIEYNKDGTLRYSGFLVKIGDTVIYHAGDTCVNEEIVYKLQSKVNKIDFAFIPVNEKNYYRDKKGLIGNMSVREAFLFTEDIGSSTIVPTHWDMFANNRTYKEEVDLLYEKESPRFSLKWIPVDSVV